MNLEVKQVEPKVWGLFVDGHIFGTSKNRFDADHGKAILEGAFYRVSCGLDQPSIPDATGHSDDPTVQNGNNSGRKTIGYPGTAILLPDVELER